MMFEVNDEVEWVGPVKTVGPYKKVVMSPGDIADVVAVSKTGVWLARFGKPGVFGETSFENIRKVQ